MYWLQDYKMVKCATNPRCVRPEDFTPHPDPEVGHKMHQLAKGEHGKLPLWRLFAATYVSLSFCCSSSSPALPGVEAFGVAADNL
jgi:hypothetical protein